MTEPAARHDNEWVRRPASAATGTNCTAEQYDAMYRRSIEESDGFWLEQAQRLDWVQAPTVAEGGLPGFDVSTWFGLFAPAGTPPAVVDRLNQAFTTALRSPEMRERLARMGAEPAPMSPADFSQFVRSELAKYEKVVKFSGARVD